MWSFSLLNKNVLLNYTIWLNLRALNMFSIKIQCDKCYNWRMYWVSQEYRKERNHVWGNGKSFTKAVIFICITAQSFIQQVFIEHLCPRNNSRHWKHRSEQHVKSPALTELTLERVSVCVARWGYSGGAVGEITEWLERAELWTAWTWV